MSYICRYIFEHSLNIDGCKYLTATTDCRYVPEYFNKMYACM
jgi:hypothetical protein